MSVLTIKEQLEELSTNQFILPIGYIDKLGVRHRVIELTEMTGEVEESIMDAKLRSNPGKLITTLIKGVTKSLGTLPNVTEDIVRELHVVDRDFLCIQNRRVSLGDIVTYQHKCENCGEVSEVSVDLSTLEATYLEDGEPLEVTFDLVSGFKDANGTVHKTITVVYPTGKVQEKMSAVLRTNPAQAITVLLHGITKKLGELSIISPDVFKKMSKRDRDSITAKISENKLGIDYLVKVPCSSCDEEMATNIPFQALLGE